MNVSGWMREMMSRSLDTETFFGRVMESVYNELLEWGHDAVVLYDWQTGEEEMAMTFIIDGKLKIVVLNKAEVEDAKLQGPFSVDKLIWTELSSEGVEIQDSTYMKYVWM